MRRLMRDCGGRLRRMTFRFFDPGGRHGFRGASARRIAAADQRGGDSERNLSKPVEHGSVDLQRLMN